MQKLALIILSLTSLTLSQSINDPYWNTQYWLKAMNVHQFWNEANTDGNSNVVIAVLGLGVEITHEDLTNNIWVNPNEVPNDGVDDDQNGYIDDYNGWNVIDNNSNVLPSSYTAKDAHETYVSGIIAAVKNNNKGITGISPGCKILPVKFYEYDQTPSWYAAKLIAAFNYVRDLQLQFSEKRFLINLSYGWKLSESNTFSPAELAAISYAIEQCYNLDIPIFCSAGNDHSQPVLFPANLWFTNSVAELFPGIDNNFNLKGQNNVGEENTFAAAGSGSHIPSYENGYRSFNGTSFATPVATGIAALLLSVRNDLTPSQIRYIMLSTAEEVGGVVYNWNPNMPGHSIELGYGKLDARLCYLAGLLNINFANDVEGNTTNFGQLKVNGTWYQTNTNLPFIIDDQVSVEAQNVLHNYNGFNNRFYNWNFIFDQNFNRTPANSFLATDEAEDMHALYRKTRPLTIRNYLEGGSADQIWFGENGEGAIIGNFQLRNSGYSENAFYYNYDANLKISYKAEAKQNITNVLNTNWKFLKWENASTNRVREEQIGVNTASEWSAIYKGIGTTDNSITYENNNVRKVVKTGNYPHMFRVYESMQNIWIERSMNNGQDWELYNNGSPLNTYPAHSPSIDYNPNSGSSGDILVISFIEDTPDGSFIKVVARGVKIQVYPEAEVFPLEENYWETDLRPTVACYGTNKFVIVWNGKDVNDEKGLCFRTGTLNLSSPFTITMTGGIEDLYCLSGTDEQSVNPAIGVNKNHSSGIYHLAWQHGSSIKYSTLALDANNQLTQSIVTTLSTGSGYLYNRYPSLVVMNDNYARVTWQGTRYEEEEAEWGKIKKEENQNSSEETEITRIVFRSSDNNYFWSFGNNTGKPNINRHSVGYAFAWSENSGSSVKAVNNTLNLANIKTLTGLSGEGVQMTNGSSINDMYAVSLNTTAAPYYFMRSNSLDSYGLSKEEALSISSGREGVVYNEGAEFYYAIGDVKLNGNNIDFVEIPDSVKTLNLSLINEYLKSQTMSVDNTSQLLYSVQYGMIDSASTKNYLQTGKTITFGVELVDAITNNVLGRYDEVTFDENNMFSYDKLGYEVSLEGIGTNREVYLRLTTTSNDETSGYSLTQRYSDETILGKMSTKKINYTGTEKPTEYALFQNYPNPFNPVTTITYQIPKEGLVTLKIYDILGKEVTTLLNEEKQAGKYSIEFNASKLSSGVYLYELRSNEYKSTKKLLLMK